MGVSLLQRGRAPDADLIDANGHQGIAIWQKREREKGSRVPGKCRYFLFGGQVVDGDESIIRSDSQPATVH